MTPRLYLYILYIYMMTTMMMILVYFKSASWITTRIEAPASICGPCHFQTPLLVPLLTTTKTSENASIVPSHIPNCNQRLPASQPSHSFSSPMLTLPLQLLEPRSLFLHNPLILRNPLPHPLMPLILLLNVLLLRLRALQTSKPPAGCRLERRFKKKMHA